MVDYAGDFPVYVPVPRRRLAEVMQLLEGSAGALDSEPPATNVDPIAGTGPKSGKPEWTPASLRNLIGEAPEKQRHVLKYLAEHAGEDVTAKEMQDYLREKTDLSPKYPGRALGAVIKALGKRAAYYDGRALPFELDWDPTLGNHYLLSVALAEPILDAIDDVSAEAPS